VRVGVSACLIGREVRYDGQHKRDGWIVDVLGRQVKLVPFCPEVEVGMGVPRDPLRLVKDGALTRMIAPRTGRDYTREMNDWAEARVRALDGERLSGFVLKQNSPSCGMQGVKLYASAQAEAPIEPTGTGLFARELRRRFPDLPIEEEGHLQDPAVRESFVQRVVAYHRRLWC